jgi:GT2 family glycosyltransferase/glycosyltransferase involved in cell wall biosynthesis
VSFDREPPVRGRDDPSTADPSDLVDEATLLGGAPDVFDDGVGVHEVEGAISEGQPAAICDDEPVPPRGEGEAGSHDLAEVRCDPEFDQVVDGVQRVGDPHEEDGSDAETGAELDGESGLAAAAPTTELEGSGANQSQSRAPGSGVEHGSPEGQPAQSSARLPRVSRGEETYTAPSARSGSKGGPLGREVAVVLVTFNAERVLPALLDSIRASRHRVTAIVAVDNGSRDATRALLTATPDVRMIAQGNTGFAHGVNRGIEATPAGSDVLVLNPDVVLEPDAIGQLAQVLDEEPDTAVVVPRLRDREGRTQASLRRDPSIARTLVETAVGGSRAGRFGEAHAPHSQEREEVEWATGAVMLLRRRVIDELGGLDESFFLYSEETELCQRVRRHGYRVRVEPAAAAIHIGGELSSDSRLWALRAVNRVRLYRQRHGLVAVTAFRAVAAAFEARRVVSGDRVSRLALRSLCRPGLDRTAASLRDELTAGRHPDDDGRRGDGGWVCYSAQDWWYHNQSHSDFQLMRGLARFEPVLVVNSLGMRLPLPGRTTSATARVLRKLRSAAKFVRQPDPDIPGFHVMTPLFLPVYGNAAIRRINGWLVHLQVALAARWIGIDRPAVVVTLPTAWEAARHLRRRCLVINRSDRYSALPEADPDVIRPLEEVLLREGDVIVYTSHQLMEEEARAAGTRARFLGHGVDLDHFHAVAPHPELEAVPHPRVGFFGGLDDYTVDVDLLRSVADRLPTAQLVLVGDASSCEIDDLLERPNVHWFGQRPYAEIPAFGAGFDVALMPWLDNDWIRHSNPIKLKEYLALGLPVVSTPFPELEHLPEGLVAVGSGSDEFVAAIESSLIAPPDPGRQRQAVRDETWTRKVDTLRAFAVEASRCAG